jgi:hypothetical protein
MVTRSVDRAGPPGDMGTRAPWWSQLVPLAALVGMLLTGCASYHGQLTGLGPTDQVPVGAWTPNPSTNQTRVNNGIYLLPQRHLILVHILVPNTSLGSLGPGAVHGAVGIWWVALDDRAPHPTGVQAGALRWQPDCVQFRTDGTGATFDIAGDHLSGPSPANLSRYPLTFNPEDSSIRVALSPADEIAIPLSGGPGGAPASLKPAVASCQSSGS